MKAPLRACLLLLTASFSPLCLKWTPQAPRLANRGTWLSLPVPPSLSFHVGSLECELQIPLFLLLRLLPPETFIAFLMCRRCSSLEIELY